MIKLRAMKCATISCICWLSLAPSGARGSEPREVRPGSHGEVRQERIEILEKALALSVVELKATADNLAQALRLNERLYNAQLSVAENKKAQVAVAEDYVLRSRELESLARERRGALKDHDLLEAKAARLAAVIARRDLASPERAANEIDNDKLAVGNIWIIPEEEANLREPTRGGVPAVAGERTENTKRDFRYRHESVGERVQVEGIAWGEPPGTKRRPGTIAPTATAHVIHQVGSTFVKGVDFVKANARGKTVRVIGTLRFHPEEKGKFGISRIPGYFYIYADSFEIIPSVSSPFLKLIGPAEAENLVPLDD